MHGSGHSNNKMRGEVVGGNVSMATTTNPGRLPPHQQEEEGEDKRYSCLLSLVDDKPCHASP